MLRNNNFNNTDVMLTNMTNKLTNKVMTDSDKISQYISQYLLELDAKDTSKQTYENSLKVFTDYITDADIKSINVITILEYKDYLRNNYKANTVNTHLTAVKSLYKWIESRGLGMDITRTVKQVKAPQGFNKNALTIDQAIQLLDSFDRDTLQGKRNYALINLMLNTALRVNEIRLADVKDIDTNSGKAILYIQGKGRDSKDSYVVLEPSVLNPIYEYLDARGEQEGALFKGLSNRGQGRLTTVSISRLVKTSLRNIGLDNPKLTAHSLRHTALTFALLGGASIQQTQQLARHSNINTTMIYAHNLDRVRNNAESNISQLLGGANNEL